MLLSLYFVEPTIHIVQGNLDVAVPIGAHTWGILQYFDNIVSYNNANFSYF